MVLEDIDIDTLVIGDDEAGIRLDKILSSRFQDSKSRTYFQYLIEQHKVLLNGLPVKKRIQPKPGDKIDIEFVYPEELSLEPENIPLDIVFEDENIIVVNKPRGMVVHPAIGHWSGTFVNALLHHCREVKSLIDVNDGATSVRPGIVHRLDKDTTGLLIAAKNRPALEKLGGLFSRREIHKEYLAIAVGNPGERTVDVPLGRNPNNYKLISAMHNGGKKAISHVKTLAFNGKLSLVSIVLVTGRTHQIRVHLQHLGTPVLGDTVYGSPRANSTYDVCNQMLHASYLRFTHPFTGQEMELKAPLPKEMERFSQNIFL